jgi:NADH dehydrogenase
MPFMRYQNILVVGGTGFIGSQVVARLAAQGRKILLATRRYENAKHLITLPGLEVVETRLDTEKAVGELLVRGSSAGKIDACMNLVGILHGRAGEAQDPYGPDFSRVHVELPQRLALACQEQGVKRLLHLSALGVNDGGKKTLPSRYLRSKAASEQVVRQTLGLQTTVIRSSVVFGENDNFLNMFARLLAAAPFVPLAGANVRFQPVYVGDLADIIVAALEEPGAMDRIWEIGGPQVFTLKQLFQVMGRISGHERLIVGLPTPLAYLQAAVMEFLPGRPLMSRDNLDSMSIDNILSDAGNERLLGLSHRLNQQWHPLETTVRSYFMSSVAKTGLNAYRSRAGR